MSKNSTHQTWNKLAQVYQDKFMGLDLYNDTYDRFIELLPQPNASLLEVGCGPGNITRYLLEKRPDYNIIATDVAPNMIELARVNNPIADCRVIAATKIDQIHQTFQAILMGFCLPYLSKEEYASFLAQAHHLLESDGLLYVSTIEGEYYTSAMQTGSTGDQMQVYYYSEEDLRRLFLKHQFAVKEVMRKPYRRSDGGEEVHLVILARSSHA